MTFFVRVMIDTADKSKKSGIRVRKRRLRSKIMHDTCDLKVGVVLIKAISNDSLRLFTDSLTNVIEEIGLLELTREQVEKRLGGKCAVIGRKSYK